MLPATGVEGPGTRSSFLPLLPGKAQFSALSLKIFVGRLAFANAVGSEAAEILPQFAPADDVHDLYVIDHPDGADHALAWPALSVGIMQQQLAFFPDGRNHHGGVT